MTARRPLTPGTLLGLGLVSLGAMLAVVLLSPLIAGFSPTLYLQPDEIRLLDRLALALPGPAGYADLIRLSVRQSGPLHDPGLRVLAVLGPVALATVAMLLALRALDRADDSELTPAHLRTVLGVGIALAVVAALAVPSYTVDFWLSTAWGRMFAHGRNAYYQSFSLADFHGIPGSNFETFERFTYGPLWALVIEGIGRVTGDRVLPGFLLQKLVLLGAWLALVWTLTGQARASGLRRATQVACLVAWLPPLLLFCLAEGHNDIAMLMFIGLWLAAVARGDHRWTPLWLTLACLTKLVAAPFVGLELLAAARAGALRRPRYWATAAGSALLVALFLARYYEGPGFLSSTAAMQRWIFWVPTTFITSLAGILGSRIPEQPVDLGIALLGLAGVALLLGRELRAPSFGGWLAAVAATMGFTLATLTGHDWPWFTLWLVPIVALGWPAPWSAVALALVLLAPVLNVAWVTRPDWSLRPWFDLPFWGAPLLVTIVLAARRRAMPAAAA